MTPSISSSTPTRYKSSSNNLTNIKQSDKQKILSYIIKGIYLIPRFRHVKLITPYFNPKNDYFVTQFTPNYRFVIVILSLSTNLTNLTAISYNIHVRYYHNSSKTTDVGFQLRNNKIMKNAIWKSYENHTFNSFHHVFPTPIPLNTKYTDSPPIGQSVQFKIFNNNSSKIYITNLKIYGN
jgi:pyruvate kinase